MESQERMPVAKVYHQVDVSNELLMEVGIVPFPQWPGEDYVLVAMIKLEAYDVSQQLNEIFRRTQHGRRRWFHGTGLIPLPLARRSTMIGDIAVLPSGMAYRYRWDRWERAYQPGARRFSSRLSAV